MNSENGCYFNPQRHVANFGYGQETQREQPREEPPRKVCRLKKIYLLRCDDE